MNKNDIQVLIEKHRRKVSESTERLDAVKRRKEQIEEEARQERRTPV